MEEFVYFVMLVAVYFAPTLVAASGRRGSVFVVNLFFGWTLLGWVIAMVMAVRSRENAASKVRGA